MKLSTVFIALVALTLVPSFALAAPPSGMQRVDPNAPCFRWPAVDMDEDGVFDRVDHCVGTPKGCTIDAWGCQSDTDRDGICDGLDRCPNTPEGMKVDENGCHEGASSMLNTQGTASPKSTELPPAMNPSASGSVDPVERELVERGRIRLENVYFETGSAKLLPESEATLRTVGRTLEKFIALEFEIEGHTDTRGSGPYNMRLSHARAGSVRTFLLDNFHLTPTNYTAKGYGETQPETEERNDEELLRNRRVVLRVLNPESLPKGVKVEEGR